jgi:hypothetical protein
MRQELLDEESKMKDASQSQKMKDLEAKIKDLERMQLEREARQKE